MPSKPWTIEPASSGSLQLRFSGKDYDGKQVATLRLIHNDKQRESAGSTGISSIFITMESPIKKAQLWVSSTRISKAAIVDEPIKPSEHSDELKVANDGEIMVFVFKG